MVNSFKSDSNIDSRELAGNVIASANKNSIRLEYFSPRHRGLVVRDVPYNEGYMSVATNLILDGVTTLRNICTSDNLEAIGKGETRAIRRCHEHLMARGGQNGAIRYFSGKSLHEQLYFDFAA